MVVVPMDVVVLVVLMLMMVHIIMSMPGFGSLRRTMCMAVVAMSEVDIEFNSLDATAELA